ncbi:MAG TPA: KGG domain-containing protein [Gemmatimonadales bacterium]
MAGNGKSRRGFASMDPARQREIASKGGKAAHAKGTAHEWSSEEARVAGRKGGEVVSRDRAHMAAIGREGGEARGQNARRARAQQRDTDTSRQVAPMADRELAREVSREGGSASRADRGERSERSDRADRDERKDRSDSRRSDSGVGLGSFSQPRGTDEMRP